jgi:glutamyl-Q tRNA(Asp) synthetase
MSYNIANLHLPHLDSVSSGPVITRFAPSPNGRLHLGHAFSASVAYDFAHLHHGQFLLRIEDIDNTRSRQEYITAILTDLEWLGLHWDRPVIYQSGRIAAYQKALNHLIQMGLAYRCVCTRSDILRAVQSCPVPHGPDGLIYPGTCRTQPINEAQPHCWRLDMRSAIAHMGDDPMIWHDLSAGPQYADPSLFGDIILWRKDAPASYHLASVCDDAADGITHIVRGQDIFAYTAVHILLQKLLGLLHPVYWHHPLLLDETGEKLAKSRASAALSALREAGQGGPDLLNALRQRKLPLGISSSIA